MESQQAYPLAPEPAQLTSKSTRATCRCARLRVSKRVEDYFDNVDGALGGHRGCAFGTPMRGSTHATPRQSGQGDPIRLGQLCTDARCPQQLSFLLPWADWRRAWLSRGIVPNPWYAWPQLLGRGVQLLLGQNLIVVQKICGLPSLFSSRRCSEE